MYFAFHLRDLMRFWGFLNYVSDVKKRISDAVNDKQVKKKLQLVWSMFLLNDS